MLWVVVAFPALNLDADDVGLFVAQGLVLALGAVVLVVGRQAWFGGVLRGIGGGMALRVATAYPSARPVRTGTTLLAYGLIVFTLVFSSVLSGVFSGQKEQLIRDEGGGFDLLVTTSSADPVPPEELRRAEGVEAVAPLGWTVAGFRVGSSGPFREWAVSGFDDALLEGGPPALETFDRGRYPNEAAVWKAVARDPELAVADVAFLQRGGGPPESNVAVGQKIEVKDPTTGNRVRREVVAISAAGAAFSGVMVSLDSLDGLVGEPVLNRHYVSVSGDPDEVAARLQRSFLASGLEARGFGKIVDGALRDQEEFFDLIEGYLALGLLIGTAGLGVVMARAAGERRRQIGVLKALGFAPSAVRAAFLLESGLVALEGTLIGASLALATSYQLVTFTTAFGEAGADFFVPWTQLVLLPAGVLAASLLAALPSALRASSEPPAAVLRAAEEGA
jgi:putative ABC transport system permease protein